jgi:hypothetical protein
VAFWLSCNFKEQFIYSILTQFMKNQNRNYFVKSIFFFVALLMFGCSKDVGVTPVAPELSIIGKWQHLITKRTENGKVISEYIGTPEDYVQITSSDIIDYVAGNRSAYAYKVIEKNKKITIIGSADGGGDDTIEIRNLTSTTMTFYQEVVINNVKYINYIDFKK